MLGHVHRIVTLGIFILSQLIKFFVPSGYLLMYIVI